MRSPHALQLLLHPGVFPEHVSAGQNIKRFQTRTDGISSYGSHQMNIKTLHLTARVTLCCFQPLARFSSEAGFFCHSVKTTCLLPSKIILVIFESRDRKGITSIHVILKNLNYLHFSIRFYMPCEHKYQFLMTYLTTP